MLFSVVQQHRPIDVDDALLNFATANTVSAGELLLYDFRDDQVLHETLVYIQTEEIDGSLQ